MHEDCARPDYMVIMPAQEPFHLYHLVKYGDRPREQDFRSRAARGGARVWPDEDAADYYSISCFDDLGVAKANARGKNWRGVASFVVDGHQGFVYAQTYEPHHYSVWGEPEVLFAAVVEVEPVA